MEPFDEKLKISVIIPVYNAGPYVRKAVESALEQPETAEVLLIEDGSPDNSLEVCKQLDAEYEKVRLFTHENNANLGAGPTRNVGIENARFDYIAFLDADDYYLPGRFEAEGKLFGSDSSIEGVYGAAGFHHYSSRGTQKHYESGYGELLTVDPTLDSDQLFDHFIGVKDFKGFITINAITVRATVFDRLDKFPEFRLCQDVDFIYRLAYSCKLAAGNIIAPVVMIGVHDENRRFASRTKTKDRETLYLNLRDWAEKTGLPVRYSRFFKNFSRLERIRRSRPIVGACHLVKGIFTRDSILLDRKLAIAAIDHISIGAVVPRLVKLKVKLFGQRTNKIPHNA